MDVRFEGVISHSCSIHGEEHHALKVFHCVEKRNHNGTAHKVIVRTLLEEYIERAFVESGGMLRLIASGKNIRRVSSFSLLLLWPSVSFQFSGVFII